MNVIKQKDYHDFMKNTVEPYLDARVKTGYTNSFDGTKLAWYYYCADVPVKTVVIVHGFTESAKKYDEIIWYFLNSGYNVFIYDQRCHGNSERFVSDYSLTHVKHFDDYVKDLEHLIVNEITKDYPLVLFAHSMGGAVSALYLEKHNDVFEKAVLSSPMIAPARGGFPLFVSKLICRIFIILGKSEKRIFLSTEYPGREYFQNSCATSEERFSYYESYKRNNKTHQNYSPTYRWTLESLKVTSKILNQKAVKNISVPLLVCTAERDDVVLNNKQEEFISAVNGCSHNFYDAKHEIFNSTDDVVKIYINDILNFLS